MLDTGTVFCYNMAMKQVKKLPVRNFVAKDLRTPKYRLKVVCIDLSTNRNFFGKLESQIVFYLKIKSLLLSFRLLSFIQFCSMFVRVFFNDAQRFRYETCPEGHVL